MEFKQAFLQFLESVKGHNWGETDRFLDKNLPLNILLPNRNPITSYEDFRDSQKYFYDNPNAQFSYEIISTEESGNLGFGVCHATVKLNPDINELIKLQICFLFKKIQGEWKLVFDQNSSLPVF